MPRSFELVQQAILGVLAAALFAGLVWLVVGNPPAWWVTMLVVEAATLAVSVAARIHRRRQVARMQADFDRPSCGEGFQ